MKLSAPPFLKSRLLLIPALAAACVLLPAITLHATQSDSVWDFSFGNQHLSTFNSPSGQLQIRINGDMIVNQQESDIKQIDGNASITERRDGQTRRMEFANEFSSNSEHQVQRRYWLNGQEHAIDADARQWLARVLPVMLRESGIDAAKRVARLHKQGGAERVLAEIEQISDSSSRSLYISLLAGAGELNAAQLDRLIRASSKIDSDFELRNALQALVEQQKPGSAAQVALLNLCADNIDSDFERRSLLQAISTRLLPDEAVTHAWQRAVEKMDSDFEARNAITSLAERPDLNPAQINAALRASGRLDSDFEHRLALEALARHSTDATLAGSFLKSAEKIESDFEHRIALVSLLKEGKLDSVAYGQLLHNLLGMESDFEVCNVLKEVAKSLPKDQALISQFRHVASNLGDFERQQAEKALSRFN